jgi:hypothetical protein
VWERLPSCSNPPLDGAGPVLHTSTGHPYYAGALLNRIPMRAVLGLLVSLAAPVPAGPLSPESPSAPEAFWVNRSGDRLTEVAGYRVAEYRNAGAGGMAWHLDGSGGDGGNGTSQLWLLAAPKRAETTFTEPSEAVAFMTSGDRNDGFATFLVDGVAVGTYDMYGGGERTLVVRGLPMRPHVLEVRMEGRKRPASLAAHVALYGGAALVIEAPPL